MSVRKRVSTVLIITLTTFISSSPTHSAGRSPTAPVNTILNGKGAPKSSLGIDGDFYIDTRSLLIYGPRTKGKWPAPKSIQGPTGPSGNDGKNGSDGKSLSNTNVNSTTGPQGLQGLPGPQGERGEKGEAGLPGANGAPGAMGPAGMPGSSGPAGTNGSQGSPGVSGPAGVAGAIGPKGETGTAGILNLISGNLTFNDLSGGLGTGQYIQLNAFEARKNYIVRVKIFSYQPNDLTEYFLPLSFTVTSTVPGVSVHTSYILAHGYSYRNGESRFENSIDAEIVVVGTNVEVAHGITLLVTAGRNTSGAELVKLSGFFSALEVQNVTIHA